jgi:hypothetical protein
MFCIFIGLLFKLDGLTPSLFIFPNGQGYFNSYLHNSLKWKKIDVRNKFVAK